MAVNKSRIRKWVKALRSGEYMQGRKRLVNEKTGKGYDRFCCLGVATDLYVQETGDTDVWEANGTLNSKVVDWYGFDDPNPYMYYEPSLDRASFLNDEFRLNFDQIADAIERTYL